MDFFRKLKTRPARSNRGFTLIELMVVVVIIGILSAIALPQIASRMHDRRGSQAAQQVAMIYRNARLRAMGRGFAVLVQYSSTTGFTVLETLTTGGVNCVPQMPPTCTTTNWTSATATRTVEQFNPATAAGGNFADVTMTVKVEPANVTATTLDMCFSPMGRTYSRTLAANPLTPTAGVVSIAVAGKLLTRTVTVLPNGMARVRGAT